MMRIHRTGFYAVVILAGFVWLVVFMMMGQTTASRRPAPRATLARHSTWQAADTRPIPLYQKSITQSRSDVLRLGIRAKRIGATGGNLRCGPAGLSSRDAVMEMSISVSEDLSS
jgi:hypothetical protein